jgi:hypothetical protein
MTDAVQLFAAFGGVLLIYPVGYFLNRKRREAEKQQRRGGKEAPPETSPYRQPAVLPAAPTEVFDVHAERDKYEHAIDAIATLLDTRDVPAQRIAMEARNRTAGGERVALTRDRYKHALEAIVVVDDGSQAARIAKLALGKVSLTP